MENKIASESFHFYTKTGLPCYEIMGKNGKLRPTNIKDCKRLGLVPSVTSILQMLPKPQLISWQKKQVLMSALTLTRLPNESEDLYIDRIMADADEQARKAREKGTAIHGAIEKFLQGLSYDIDREYIRGVIIALSDHLKVPSSEWIPACEVEKSFAHCIGYGGKVDLHSRELNMVADVKTSEFTEDKKLGYQDHLIQLVAYAHGLNMPKARLLNIYVSTKIPGLVKVVEYSKGKEEAFEVFKKCLGLWRLIKKYPKEIKT